MNARLQAATFGKYQLIASLGQGGMANVYLALVAGPGGFNKLLVVKAMRADVIDSIEGGLEMFLDEARLTARLVHPNIASTYEVGEDSGTYFIAMEYLEGQTYRALCNRARAEQLPLEAELRILAETARGLHHAHELLDFDGTPLRVVHRDVSPQNIFVTYDGQVKLLDFGIAKTSEAEHETQIGVIKGKIDYIAPEQLRAEDVDCRADVFALGALLWEALTRKRFAGGRKLGEVAKVQNRLTGGERKVRDVRPDVAEPLARMVDRAIALKPEDRFESALAFAEAIDEYLAEASLKPTAKALAAIITPLFEVERTSMRKTIEENVQLSKRRVARPGFSAALPSVRPTPDFESTSGTWLAPVGDDTRVPRTSDRVQENREDTRAARAADRSGEITHTPSPALPSDTITASGLAPLKRRAPQLTTAVAVAAIGALVGGLLAFDKSPWSSPPLTANPASISAPEASSPPAAPVSAAPVAGTVHLQLGIWPPSAHATLDGTPLSTPFAGEFLKDGISHQLVVRAEGYRPSRRLITFDRDAALSVSLEKVQAPPAPPPKRVLKKPAAPLSRSGARNIDVDDPYAN